MLEVFKKEFFIKNILCQAMAIITMFILPLRKM